MSARTTMARWLLVTLTLLYLITGINAQAQTTRATSHAEPDVLRVPPPDEDPPYNNAMFRDQSVPGTMTAGSVYTVTVRMVNNGTTTWTSGAAYALGSRNPTDNGTWGGGRVGLAGAIAPGQIATFTFNVTAPASPGRYNFQWAMVQDGVAWFGAMADNVVVNVTAPARVNNALLIGQLVPSQMTTGGSYSVAMTMQNTGNTTWVSSALYNLGSPLMNGVQFWNGGRVAMPRTVAPGEQVTFSFTVTAPLSAGSYPFNFLMVQDGVEFFGQASNSIVNVVASPRINGASVVAQSVPATMTVGQNYPVTMTMQNTGNTTWASSALYNLGSPLINGVQYWNDGRVPMPRTVVPGEQVTFTFIATAPSTAGRYPFNFLMVQDGVEFFGQSSGLTVDVGGGDTVTYIHTDALGSPVARSDSAGTVISRTSYEPYGRTASGVTPTIGFTGHMNDADTGLVYMQQRYYDPMAGRFLSVDPVTTDANTGGSFNRYVYAGNNPYKYIDPDGRERENARNPMQREREYAPDAPGCGFICHGTPSFDAASGSTSAGESSSFSNIMQGVWDGGKAVFSSTVNSLANASPSSLSPNVTTGSAGKIQVVIGPIDVTATMKGGSVSSLFVGVRVPGLMYSNTIEGQAKIGNTQGWTAKLSGSIGWGAGITGGASIYSGVLGNMGGAQVSGGIQGRTRGIWGIAPPSPSFGWTSTLH